MGSVHAQLAALAAGAYFLGAVPFGLILGKLKGIDIRQHGSKNIGASNAGRVLGRKFFGITLALDALKSLVPMLIASALVAPVPLDERSRLTYLLWLGVGVMAILGHVFPIYLKFRGGKGVATGAGVFLGLWPYFTLAGVVTILTFVLVLKATHYISVSSIAAAIVFPLSYVAVGLSQHWDLTGRQLPLLILACLISGLVVWRHRDNLKRLRAGTENRIRVGTTKAS